MGPNPRTRRHPFEGASTCRQRSPRFSQYTSREYAALAGEHDVALSMGRTGQWWDAVAESFFASLKGECIDPPGPADPLDGSPGCGGSTHVSFRDTRHRTISEIEIPSARRDRQIAAQPSASTPASSGPGSSQISRSRLV